MNHKINRYQEKNHCRQKFLVSIISMEYINDPSYLKIESVRLDTFHTWPLNGAVSREEVARQGFYYTGHKDAVACVFCRGHLEKWVQTDVVSTEHSKWFPDCPFVQGRECGNVPRQNTNPKIPAYTFFYDRLDSFSNTWSKDDNISADKMASAGFFYIGPSDRVQCFNCGLKLDQWEATDNAWDEHKKYKRDQCSFVKERHNCYLSRQLFTECSLLNQDPYHPSRRPGDRVSKLPREESQPYLSDLPSKEILKHYSPLTELHPSSSSNKSSSNQYESLQQPSLNLSPTYMVPTTSTQENLSKSTETVAAAAIAKELVPLAPAKSQASLAPTIGTSFLSAISSGQESVSSSKSATALEIESLRQQLAKLENEVYCKICFENHIEIVFKPCKHMVCCIECSKSQQHCPICRTEINEKERIYRP
ncbi:baculoviral IAP repeat-containing protein 7-B isoform X2 [Octopus bimaculoides]|uniref:RING-type domain-containing protein n=1 Tax=Octopus bimaculoides TaxID=37653 RepID=A0A0L8G0N3_OCTBM|nr:baculoviral IAP repeat-containing protein 7-B isoform X2 [Octopus bimaculoides]|eukprot:XP_014785152.1 PREDICTED: baculoviral IAP repeat-containing protein 7-B-like isoform X2 [Octopus bimaculoides]